ncbi:MAG: hypothetical protein A3F82_10445 [Deltaproteobacteria bacterium RIFCSPLOWO2_12_FULL_44_12]|nr:MAG: hypothetical protein A2712_07625 [Deltaproteobacteria bacterium RIFCSPHIGHO2_01_FULL_43_49]OGQ14788.1 MAG: hypothetical protein A3D22_09370 [Deltaproteobacteria bacterium RIFCSPHIGHO2_02_FULL_44_53]OGQ28174.1 MAG: hypothetical protein A3D98_08080 [Deltaproteobacteria bacterium RIFCSPHIGHO2_12_FULL_44_21]OGQ31386.1 MAG: hypothetical protein A2979_08130 [Deltaproteobacteria bacterium RIFCSPLOWO2_01_FULL_45_74]OGQ43378.1 MAG: hypothetical protein A3I70_01790 [Deltaproteobacteria bacterium 
MHKGTLLLILLGFIGFYTPLFAQDARITGNPGNPEKGEAKENYQMSQDQWEINERIKNNFNHLNTVPLYNSNDIEVQLGPAQFQFTIPF